MIRVVDHYLEGVGAIEKSHDQRQQLTLGASGANEPRTRLQPRGVDKAGKVLGRSAFADGVEVESMKAGVGCERLAADDHARRCSRYSAAGCRQAGAALLRT